MCTKLLDQLAHTVMMHQSATTSTQRHIFYGKIYKIEYVQHTLDGGWFGWRFFAFAITLWLAGIPILPPSQSEL